MIHLDLFSGIGGFAYAVDQIWDNAEHIFCDNNKFCQEVLKKHWKGSQIYGDIRELTAIDTDRNRPQEPRSEQQTNGDRQLPETITNTEGGQSIVKETGNRGEDISRGDKEVFLLTGGFPCQPFSQAGKRKGTDDNRYLWPEMLRVIRDFKPTWVIAENVRGLLTIEQGMVFESVCLDLEASGYEVQAFIIPAVAVNAPHRRDRVWIVANRQGVIKERSKSIGDRQGQSKEKIGDGDSHAPDAEDNGLQYSGSKENPECQGTEWRGTSVEGNNSWDQNWLEVATELCGIYDELPLWVDGYFKKIIGKEFYGASNNKNRTEDLRILRNAVQQEKVWKEIGRLFEMDDKEILLKILLRIEEVSNGQDNLQHQSEESQKEDEVRSMWEYSDFMRSPHRRKHQEQFARELKSIVQKLSYETALEIAKTWDCLQCCHSSLISPEVDLDGFKLTKAGHRVERLKALGNSIVPQVAIEIMKAIKYAEIVSGI